MICVRCKIDKTLDNFCKDKHKKKGYKGTCKSCCLIKVDKIVAHGGVKLCTKCNVEKPIDEYKYFNNGRINGACRSCKIKRIMEWRNRPENKSRIKVKRIAFQKSAEGKAYSKNMKLKCKYKLSQEDFDNMLKSQDFKCYICKSENPGKHGTFYVDHDHSCCPGQVTCGKCIRGLLCQRCNRALGLFRDDIPIITEALEYLKKFISRKKGTTQF